MAITNKQLFAPAQLAIANGTFYTVPTNRTTVITKASFSNTSASAVAVSAHLVPAGDSVTAINQIIDGFILDGGETFSSPDMEGQVLPQQSTIQMSADANAAVTVIFSGIEIA